MTNELLSRKQYLLGITIIEGRQLLGKDSAGTSDPFVRIKCAGQVQQTSKKYEVNSACWNQSLTFPNIMMNQYELETFELNLEVYDHNALLANEMIGQYSIGLSTLHRNLNHEFYKVWVGLFDRENPNVTQGYLQFSTFIVGPNETPPVHSQDEDFGDDVDEDSEEDDDAIARKIESIKRAQGILQVLAPGKINKSFQMTVVIAKAQDLPKCEGDKGRDGKIKPFVSARVFGCVQTSGIKGNINPVFNAKLQFPIFYPILNNKITMRIWHAKGGLKANTFIASIPEHPDGVDQFNLTKLMTQDGRMKARWLNLYGTHPLDRGNNTKGKKEGSCYLGRVLIAFNLVSNDRPQLMSQVGNAINEPKSMKYQLWLDLYHFVDCDIVSKGAPIWAQISIGKFLKKSDNFTYKKDLQSYRYKACQVEALEDIPLPLDQSQIPDVFIDIYTNNTFSSEVRIAYTRIKAVDIINTKSRPTWYRMSSPYNDTGTKSIGSLQANIQLLRNGEAGVYEPVRMVKKKQGKQQYKFYFHILQGFELATSIPESMLNTKVEIKIGNLSVDKDGCKTDFLNGHYPIWNEYKVKDVFLETELAFESDMRITVQNQKKGMFGSLSNQVIGEFCVPVQTIMCYSSRPQFFNLINEEGKFMGQILANFFLKPYVRDPKTRKIKGYVDPTIAETLEKFSGPTAEKWKVDIKFSILGIRNLIFKAVKPKIKVRITNDKSSEQIIQMSEDWKESSYLGIDGQTCNPNFGQMITFPSVSLAYEPLFWPYIEVKVVDEEKENALIKNLASGCEDCFTTISLVDYAHELMDEVDLLYAKAQITRNQDRLLMIQSQISDLDFLRNIGVVINMNNLLGGDIDEGEQGTPGGGSNMRQSVMPNGQLMNVLGDGGNNKDKQREGTAQNLWNDWQKDNVLKEEVSVILKGLGDDGNDDGGQAGDVGGSDDDEDDGALIVEVGGDGNVNDLETGVIVELDNIDQIQVMARHKVFEEELRAQQLADLNAELRAFMKKLKTLTEKVDKDKVKLKMMELTDEMDSLRNQNMTEAKFWGMLALNDEAAFDYGRDILKEGTYETAIKLPYEQYPLFVKADWYQESTQKPIVSVAGILRSGNLSGATIKGKIQMDVAGEEGDGEGEEEDDKAKSGVKANEETQEKPKEQKEEKKAGNRSEKILEIVNEIQENFPFDMMKPQYLEILNNDWKTYKIRIYLISAQNLTATGVSLDFKSRLAGMTALCTASPYPVIKVGNGINNEESNIVKKASDKDRYLSDNLNPQFFRIYELEANFPEDWRLDIQIWDKGAFVDSLIGSTTIDLENRLFANTLYMDRYALALELNDVKKETMEKNKKKKQFKKELVKLKARQRFILEQQRKLNSIEQILIPVEFRELLHPSKSQAQGIVEMWTEIYTVEEYRKIPFQGMQTMKTEVYEIRLIVWETRDVPLIDGDDVDIYCRVTFDPTGNPEDEVEKRTDVHQNSKTGWGQFNWRFKFQITVPCEFPRIKFTIFDEGVITDEAIGEASLNLKKTISKMERDGFIEVPKTYITCSNANMIGEDRGNLMFSMTILTLEDAQAEPVGEAQEEPNENPFLLKPTAGRGLAAMLSGIGGFNLDFSWNPFGKYLPFIFCMIIVVGLLALAVYLKMMGIA